MGKRIIKEKYLRLTEETNALDYLERAGQFIKEAATDPKAWKWVILSLHGALYGFAISAAKGSDYQSVVKTTKKGRERLITLDEALAMCQDEKWMGTLYGGVALNLTASQKDSIRRMKETLRNNFEHYIPGGWSIEIHGFPRISIDILDVIRFLAVEAIRYQHLSQAQRKKIKSVIFQSKKILKALPLYKELLEAESGVKSDIQKRRKFCIRKISAPFGCRLTRR